MKYIPCKTEMIHRGIRMVIISSVLFVAGARQAPADTGDEMMFFNFNKRTKKVPARYFPTWEERQKLEGLKWISDPSFVDVMYIPELRTGKLPENFSLPYILATRGKSRSAYFDMLNALEWVLASGNRHDNISHLLYLREMLTILLVSETDELEGGKRRQKLSARLNADAKYVCPFCSTRLVPFGLLDENERARFVDLKTRAKSAPDERQESFFYLNPITKRLYHDGLGDLRFAFFCSFCSKGFHFTVDSLSRESVGSGGYDDLDHIKGYVQLDTSQVAEMLHSGLVCHVQVGVSDLMEKHGKTPQLLTYLANCKEIRGQVMAALPIYQEVVRIAPNDRQAQLNLIRCCWRHYASIGEEAEIILNSDVLKRELVAGVLREPASSSPSLDSLDSSERKVLAASEAVTHFVITKEAAQSHIEAGRMREAFELIKPYLEAINYDAEQLKFSFVLAFQAEEYNLCISLASRFAAIGGSWEKTESYINESRKRVEWKGKNASEEEQRKDEAGFARHLHSAVRCYEAREYDAALKDCDTCLRIFPENSSALVEQGNVLHRMGRLKDAADSYLEAIKLNPASVIAHTELASMIIVERNEIPMLNKALAYLQKAQCLAPDDPRVKQLLAHLVSMLTGHYSNYKDECIGGSCPDWKNG